MGGGFAGTVISRRGAEFFWRWLWLCWLLGGMTPVSSGTAAGVADMTNRP